MIVQGEDSEAAFDIREEYDAEQYDLSSQSNANEISQQLEFGCSYIPNESVLNSLSSYYHGPDRPTQTVIT